MCINQQPSECKRYYTPEEITTGKHEIGRKCFDGKDNDNDGKKDCLDPDCEIYGICRVIIDKDNDKDKDKERLCFDGTDGKNNDTDTDTDCDNPECKKDPRANWHCGRDIPRRGRGRGLNSRGRGLNSRGRGGGN